MCARARLAACHLWVPATYPVPGPAWHARHAAMRPMPGAGTVQARAARTRCMPARRLAAPHLGGQPGHSASPGSGRPSRPLASRPSLASFTVAGQLPSFTRPVGCPRRLACGGGGATVGALRGTRARTARCGELAGLARNLGATACAHQPQRRTPPPRAPFHQPRLRRGDAALDSGPLPPPPPPRRAALPTGSSPRCRLARRRPAARRPSRAAAGPAARRACCASAPSPRGPSPVARRPAAGLLLRARPLVRVRRPAAARPPCQAPTSRPQRRGRA